MIESIHSAPIPEPQRSSIMLHVSDALAQEVWSQAESYGGHWLRLNENPRKVVLLSQDEAVDLLDWANMMLAGIRSGGMDLDDNEKRIGSIWRHVRMRIESQLGALV